MLVLVRFVGMIRTVVLRVFVIPFVTVLVGVPVLVRMTVFDVSMTVFVIMGMSVFALVFVFHRFSFLDRRIQHFKNETSGRSARGGAPRR
jgi:hypothetical protein